MDSEKRSCQNCKKEFTVEPADFEFYEKVKAPPPVECFPCRLQRRLAFWPFGKFHKRTDDLTGEKIITIHAPGVRFPVYKNTNWYSDKWEAPSLDYDPGRPFFEQMYELQNKTPRPHQYGSHNTDCDYSDDVWESKNCYLCRSLGMCEDLSYSYRTVRCRDSYDLLYCYDMEQSYDCTYCFNSARLRHSFNSRDCMDSAFLYDCRNVRNSFMCWNLRNKEYYILNEPYSKEEYFKKLKEYHTGSWSEFRRLEQEFAERLKNDAVHRTNLNFKVVRSSGNYLTNCKNCRECFFLEDAEDCSYFFRGLVSKDCSDVSGVWKSQLCYDIAQLTDGFQLKHSSYCENCRYSEYLDFCVNCEYCFGCVGLRNKKFCILNKQYPEEEYYRLAERIRDDMRKEDNYGRFFPYKMAAGGYNYSLAGIFYPKTKEEVEKLGGVWEDPEKADFSGVTVAPFTDDIKDVSEDIISKGLICEETGRPFNLKKDELEYLKKYLIPLPRYYPDVRAIRRMKKLFYIKPYPTHCVLCSKDIVSYYPPEWGYKKILCEECYQKEIV